MKSIAPLPPRGRFALREYAPVPLVGVAVVLAALIVVTPVLVSEGQPAPGILTQAELIVDRVAGGSETHFYVHGLGTTVRYDAIWFGEDANLSWSGSGSPDWSSLHYTSWQNGTFVLSLGLTSPANPIAVNVTAYYSSAGGSAYYTAVLALFVGPGPTGETLYLASDTPGVAVRPTVPVDNSSLPLTILMAVAASGGPT